MDQFRITEEKTGFVEECKSKFYSFAIPVNDVDSFKQKLELIRKSNLKAKHIVYAYRIGNQAKSCDDREPKGTAGRPILEFLMKKNLIDVAVIVVRYYGGTQLGASRLLRTYLNSAIDAVNKCQLVEVK